MKKKGNNYMVPALEKGLNILEKLAKSEGYLRITDIHEQMGIPKTSVFMILSTLETMEYIEKVDDNRYRLTMKIYNIGNEVIAKYDIRGIARPIMEEMAEKLKFTVHLAVLSSGKAVYIEKVDGPTFVQFGTRIGHSIHVHFSAVGKVLAASLEDHQLDEIIETNPLVRKTEHTITSPEIFKNLLVSVRELGYAIEDEEGEIGVRCIGAPIFNKSGKVIAAISITSIRNDLQSNQFHEIGTVVKDYGMIISEQLGYSNPSIK